MTNKRQVNILTVLLFAFVCAVLGIGLHEVAKYGSGAYKRMEKRMADDMPMPEPPICTGEACDPLGERSK